MLTDRKEQIKEQQAQSDWDREHATLDRENAIRKQEALRQLNNQLQAQITVLHNILTSAQSKREPKNRRISRHLYPRQVDPKMDQGG